MPSFAELFPTCTGLVSYVEPPPRSTARSVLAARAAWKRRHEAAIAAGKTTEDELYQRQARQWCDTKPHKFGEMKRCAMEAGLNYSTFFKSIRDEEAARLPKHIVSPV